MICTFRTAYICMYPRESVESRKIEISSTTDRVSNTTCLCMTGGRSDSTGRYVGPAGIDGFYRVRERVKTCSGGEGGGNITIIYNI